MTRSQVLWMVGWLSLCVALPQARALPSKRTPSANHQAKTAFNQGYQAQKAGHYQEAIEAYEESLRYDSKQAEALNNVGFCYKSLKRYQKAIGYYKEALAINPQLAEAHEYLGEAYLGLGKLELAKREYKVLRTLDPHEARELKEKLDAALEKATPSSHD